MSDFVRAAPGISVGERFQYLVTTNRLKDNRELFHAKVLVQTYRYMVVRITPLQSILEVIQLALKAVHNGISFVYLNCAPA